MESRGGEDSSHQGCVRHLTQVIADQLISIMLVEGRNLPLGSAEMRRKSDFEHYRERAEQEKARAAEAANPAVKTVHSQMAERYEQLLNYNSSAQSGQSAG